MMDKMALKIAASTLVLGVTVVGCTPASNLQRPASLASSNAPTQQDVTRAYAKLQKSYQAGKLDEALQDAEALVELSPADVGYRMVLAELYLKNGRFQSAETTFSDVLSLSPGNEKAALSLALAQIAQARNFQAAVTLNQIADSAPPADVGLAFALAGDPQRAIALLEPAARAPGATGRVRQNLALAYALAGDWAKARTVAAQDVSAADLNDRLQQWASFAQPKNSYEQVASLLGVTPVEDPGQPVRLALVTPAAEEIQLASAEPVAEVPHEPAVAEVPQFAEAPAPVAVAVAASSVPAEIAPAPAPVPAPAPAAPVTRFAQAVQAVASLQPAMIRASYASAPSRPARAATAKAAPRAEPRKAGSSRFVVQIGAYKSSSQVEAAWTRAHRRFAIGSYTPLSTVVNLPGKGTFHRLSVSGFATQAEAVRVCGSIRAKGGACFVRVNAGDAPIRWANRNNKRTA